MKNPNPSKPPSSFRSWHPILTGLGAALLLRRPPGAASVARSLLQRQSLLYSVTGTELELSLLPT